MSKLSYLDVKNSFRLPLVTISCSAQFRQNISESNRSKIKGMAELDLSIEARNESLSSPSMRNMQVSTWCWSRRIRRNISCRIAFIGLLRRVKAGLESTWLFVSQWVSSSSDSQSSCFMASLRFVFLSVQSRYGVLDFPHKIDVRFPNPKHFTAASTPLHLRWEYFRIIAVHKFLSAGLC